MTLLVAFGASMAKLNDLTCIACCGYGHTTVDGASGKKKEKRCIVNELVDVAYAEAANKKNFNEALGKKVVKAARLGLTLRDGWVED